MKFRTADLSDKRKVIELWHRCGLTRPWNSPDQDFEFALEGPSSAVLIIEHGSAIVGSVMAGHDGHRGTVYYVSVDPSQQGSGLGAKLMEFAESWLKQQGVWKLNLLVRKDNAQATDFYKRIGYTDTECISLGKRFDERMDVPSKP